MQHLTLAVACEFIDSAIAEARKQEFAPMAVVVLDSGGNLVAFKREDGAGIARFDIAFGKAWGSLGLGFGSRELAKRAAQHPVFFQALSTVTTGRIVPSPGGVLVLNDAKEIIAAIGISGDLGGNDEVCAIAAIEHAGFTAAAGSID